MTDLPTPPVPADCDLTDFPYMELDVRRLRDSKFSSTPNAEAFRAGVLLWCSAWHQVPASSLPDDDVELASLAGYGRMKFSVREWRKVRAEALTGFVKCSDGRLYHTVIAEKAVAAWAAKQQAIKARASDTAKKAGRRRAMPRWLNLEERRQINRIYEMSSRLSSETGIQHHVDHIVPINGDGVCGLHVPWNLRVILASQNMAKSNVFDAELGIAA